MDDFKKKYEAARLEKRIHALFRQKHLERLTNAAQRSHTYLWNIPPFRNSGKTWKNAFKTYRPRISPVSDTAFCKLPLFQTAACQNHLEAILDLRSLDSRHLQTFEWPLFSRTSFTPANQKKLLPAVAHWLEDLSPRKKPSEQYCKPFFRPFEQKISPLVARCSETRL